MAEVRKGAGPQMSGHWLNKVEVMNIEKVDFNYVNKVVKIANV